MRGVTRSEAHLGHDRVAELSPRVEGLLPAARAQAPAAAGLEDTAQVVALVSAEPPRVSPASGGQVAREELLRHDRADGVAAAILRTRLAEARPKEAADWIGRCAQSLESRAEHIERLGYHRASGHRSDQRQRRVEAAAIRGKDASKVERHYDVTSSDPSPQIAPELRRDTQSDENTA